MASDVCPQKWKEVSLLLQKVNEKARAFQSITGILYQRGISPF
jgi:hypothetical protein